MQEDDDNSDCQEISEKWEENQGEGHEVMKKELIEFSVCFSTD